MTALPTTHGADERFVVVRAPRPGTTVEVAPGSQLAVRFRPRIGASGWHVSALPSHVLVLAGGGHEFQFLVFAIAPGSTDAGVPIRFERRDPVRDMAHEVCELRVIPVHDGASGSGRATRRSA